MTVRVDCGCGHVFEAADPLSGGVTNCPRCGRAVDVPGLRDPFWRGLQVLGAVAAVVATALTWQAYGAGYAVLVAAALAGLFWLLSRAL